MTAPDLTRARLEELLAAGKRFAGDPNLYRPRLFDIVTRKDGADRRYEGEWIRDVMRDVPTLAARVIELEAEVERLREVLGDMLDDCEPDRPGAPRLSIREAARAVLNGGDYEA